MAIVKINANELAQFKSRWPCHGISDKVNTITFEFESNGDLVDVIARAKNGHQLSYEYYDGAACLALSQDAQKKLEK